MTTVIDARTTTSVDDVIGYSNFLRTGTITTSAGTGSYAADWRLDRTWEPGATTAWIQAQLSAADTINYVAICGHNLGTTGASVSMQHGSGAGGTTLTAQAITDDETVFILFDDVSNAYHRLTISGGSSAPVIACVSFGTSLVLQSGIKPGWVPSGFGDAPDVIDTVSEDGFLVERVVLNRPHDGKLMIPHMDRAWMRANWKPFRAHAISRAWFIGVGFGTADADAILAWTDGVPPPDAVSAIGYQSVNWPIKFAIGRTVAAGDTIQELCTQQGALGVFLTMVNNEINFDDLEDYVAEGWIEDIEA